MPTGRTSAPVVRCGSQCTSRHELVTPDEFMRSQTSPEIPLRQGQEPVLTATVGHFTDGEFLGLVNAG